MKVGSSAEPLKSPSDWLSLKLKSTTAKPSKPTSGLSCIHKLSEYSPALFRREVFDVKCRRWRTWGSSMMAHRTDHNIALVSHSAEACMTVHRPGLAKGEENGSYVVADQVPLLKLCFRSATSTFISLKLWQTPVISKGWIHWVRADVAREDDFRARSYERQQPLS